MSEKLYDKILVAKKSEKNQCFAEDGEWLIVAQKEHKMIGKLPSDHHFFVGVNSKKPSRYGWVKQLKFKISPIDLAKKYIENPNIALIESCKFLLDSLKNQKEGVPMACTYSTIGVMEKQRRLKIHRVFFYQV